MPKKINSNWKNRFFNNNHKKKITTSFEVYKERTRESFDLLNFIDHKNLYRVYPHNLYCNNIIINRCITHSDEYIYYSDDDHPSRMGSVLIGNLIMEEINKIDANRR